MSTSLTSMRAPSAALLRAFLQPTSSTLCQTRAASNYVPRKKYAKITALDKLHRKQKADLRAERLAGEIRAKNLPPPPSSIFPTTPSPASETPSSSSQPPVPYSIHRTPLSNALPVYQSTKSGGTKRITTLRKLSGDLALLQKHLQDALAMEQTFIDRQGRKKDNISINWQTKQIVVRGWRAPEVRRWAEMVGF